MQLGLGTSPRPAEDLAQLSNFIQRQTSPDPEIHETANVLLQKPTRSLPCAQAACEMEHCVVKALRGHPAEDTHLLRGPFLSTHCPPSMNKLTLVHRVRCRGQTPMTWKAAGKRLLLLGLQGPPQLWIMHGWKRREGNHVQVRKLTVTGGHETHSQGKAFHTLRSSLCPCGHRTEQGAVSTLCSVS